MAYTGNSTLDSGSRGVGLSPVGDHQVVFLSKTLYSHSGTVAVSTQVHINHKFNAGGNAVISLHPIQRESGSVQIILLNSFLISCLMLTEGNQDRLW